MIYTLTLNPAVDRELTVSQVQYDTVLRASHERIDFGGKGFNVSRLLQSLHTPSTAVGFLGGKSGEILQDGLKALGIATDFVWIPGETRTTVSIVDQSSGHYIKVNEKGPPVDSDKQAQLLEKIAALAQAGDWWVLAGSLPPRVPDSFYADVIRLLHRHGARAILDTSGESLRLGCQASPDMVKPNASEARQLTGLPLETLTQAAAAAHSMHQIGAQNVIISLGQAGGLLRTAGAATWFAASPPVLERNPTGAGDAMVGGLVWALAGGLSPQVALGWGVACGAASASLDGTEMGTQAYIEELFQQVLVEDARVPDKG
ncbi:MAG: 1-phosphofructokinase [Anaerolineaceae bacterium]|nr:1-phosphofructokinase [Anaerolineaceae bacterium]